MTIRLGIRGEITLTHAYTLTTFPCRYDFHPFKSQTAARRGMGKPRITATNAVKRNVAKTLPTLMCSRFLVQLFFLIIEPTSELGLVGGPQSFKKPMYLFHESVSKNAYLPTHERSSKKVEKRNADTTRATLLFCFRWVVANELGGGAF